MEEDPGKHDRYYRDQENDDSAKDELVYWMPAVSHMKIDDRLGRAHDQELY